MPAIPIPDMVGQRIEQNKTKAARDNSGQVKPSVGGSKSTSPDRKLEATMISKDLGALGLLVFISVATSEGEIYGGRRKGIQLPPITLVKFWQKFLECYEAISTSQAFLETKSQ